MEEMVASSDKGGHIEEPPALEAMFAPDHHELITKKNIYVTTAQVVAFLSQNGTATTCASLSLRFSIPLVPLQIFHLNTCLAILRGISPNPKLPFQILWGREGLVRCLFIGIQRIKFLDSEVCGDIRPIHPFNFGATCPSNSKVHGRPWQYHLP